MKPSLGVHLFALLLFIGLFFLFSNQTRVLFAGYSFSDEYELLTVTKNLEHRSVLEEYQIRQKAESIARFRPVACFLRTVEIGLVGEHVRIHRAWRILLGVATAFLFYWFCRRIGWTFFQAFLFSFLTLFGKQVWTWWLPSTQEGLGIFFVACAFLGLAFHDPLSQKRHWADGWFVAGCVLASLSKESFIIVLPGLAFFRIWLMKERYAWTWRQSFRQNLGIGLALCLVCLAEILFIVYVAPGPQGPGYAGFKGILPDSLYKVSWELVRYGNGAALGLLFLAATVSAFLGKKRGVSTLVPPFIFWFLMAVPSILLHQLSGFIGAYCLPGVLGFSYTIVYFYRVLLTKRSVWIRVVFLAFLSWVVFPNLQLALNDAARYAKECEGIQQVLDEIQTHTVPSDSILIAANPARHIEWGVAIKIFLELQRDRSNIYYYPVHKPYYNDFERSLLTNPKSLFNVYRGRVARNQDLGHFKVIAVLPTMEYFFLKQSRTELNVQEYRRVKSGQFTVYIKKDVPIENSHPNAPSFQ